MINCVTDLITLNKHGINACGLYVKKIVWVIPSINLQFLENNVSISL